MKLESNIWKLYIIKGARMFLLFMPIIVLFFQENGLSMTEIIFLQSIFAIAIVLFEIPSGYVADRIGRKKIIILGSLLSVIAIILMALSYDFWGFALAEFLMGISTSFISGADSALLYDSLLKLNRKKEYKRIQGRMLGLANFSEAIAAIVGGALAVISLRTPIYAEIGVVVFAALLSFTLIEPPREKLKAEKGELQRIIEIVRYALHGHPKVKWYIIFSALMSSASLTMAWFAQPYFSHVGIALAHFGVLWMLLNATVGATSFVADTVEERIGRKQSIFIMFGLTVIAFLTLGIVSVSWGIIAIFLVYIARGMNRPLMLHYINELVSSDKRATTISVMSLLVRLLFSILGPLWGVITDVYSLSTAFQLMALFYIVCGGISLIYLRKHNALTA